MILKINLDKDTKVALLFVPYSLGSYWFPISSFQKMILSRYFMRKGVRIIQSSEEIVSSMKDKGSSSSQTDVTNDDIFQGRGKVFVKEGRSQIVSPRTRREGEMKVVSSKMDEEKTIFSKREK